MTNHVKETCMSDYLSACHDRRQPAQTTPLQGRTSIHWVCWQGLGCDRTGKWTNNHHLCWPLSCLWWAQGSYQIPFLSKYFQCFNSSSCLCQLLIAIHKMFLLASFILFVCDWKIEKKYLIIRILKDSDLRESAYTSTKFYH